MIHSPKYNLLRPASLLVVLLLHAASGAGAVAQDFRHPLLRVPPLGRSAEPPGPWPEEAMQPPLDYWIVSSRHCPQSGIPQCTAEQLDYFHVDAAGRLRPCDLATYQSQIDPRIPICVVVHGSYSPWRSVVKESALVFRWLRNTAPEQPLQVVFYTWPSDPVTAVLPGIDFAIFGKRASYNGFYLSQFIQQTPEGSRISFFAHSHGSRVVASALHLLGGGELRGYQLRVPGCGQRRLRPIFAAAAIDHHWLNPGERFGCALNQIDAGLVLYNVNDLALTLYPLRRLFSHRPLGLVGFDRHDRLRQCEQGSLLAEVDVTAMVGIGHFWTHYFTEPCIADAMKPYLFFYEGEPHGASRTRAGTWSDRADRAAYGRAAVGQPACSHRTQRGSYAPRSPAGR